MTNHGPTSTAVAQKTWAQLQAEGVRRCCVMFGSGRQCRRRAVDLTGWCVKHGRAMATIDAKVEHAIANTDEPDAD